MLNLNTKSDYVTLTLDIGAHVHILHLNMFRYTLLPNIIKMHQHGIKIFYLLSINIKSDYVTLTLGVGDRVHI